MGVWGYAPPGNFDSLRHILAYSQTNIECFSHRVPHSSDNDVKIHHKTLFGMILQLVQQSFLEVVMNCAYLARPLRDSTSLSR